VLDAGLGWWWADAVAAVLISGVLLMEGARAVVNAAALPL
jgi:divalent metal cation (Fe/Co/Zn/Cd) transporter